MILLQINTANRDQAMEILDYLWDQNLVLNPTIIEQEKFQKNEKTGRYQATRQLVISGHTKALLFDTINRELAQKYPSQTPLLYALPIVYMDAKNRELIKNANRSI